jgi:glycerophosphoryl diester phosphodiesterase
MPENTVPAFLKATELGFNTLEMDVVISKDGEIVLSHEPWMSHKICSHPDGAPVKKGDAKRLNLYRMDYEEIRQFDCGSRFHPDFPHQMKMKSVKPTLKMVVRSVQGFVEKEGYAMPAFNIELKSRKKGDDRFHPAPAKFVELVVAEVRRLGIEEATTLQSFDLRVLEELNKVAERKFAISYLVSRGKSVDKHVKRLSFVPEILSPKFKLVSEEMVEACHNRGMRIIPWTINDRAMMEKFKAWGCDGGITDGFVQ